MATLNDLVTKDNMLIFEGKLPKQKVVKKTSKSKPNKSKKKISKK